jgi:tetratricopeptide (TPR) repeat protein
LLLALAVFGVVVWTSWSGGKGRVPRLLAEGEETYRQGRWTNATNLAHQVLRIAPDSTEAVRLLARSAARLGRDAQANSLFARLGEQSLQPEDLYLLGLGLNRAGRNDEAVGVWQKALAGEPDHAESLEHLAKAYAMSNRLVEASQLSERLAKRPGWEVRGGVNLASLRAELNDPSGATTALQKVMSRPDVESLDRAILTSSRKLLARSLLRLGNAAEGQSLLERITASDPDPEAFWLLSRAWLQKGVRDQAALALDRAGGYRADHPLDLEPAPYLGEDRCTECHREIARAYHGSRSTTTLVRGEGLLRLPYPDKPLPDPENAQVTHRFNLKEGKVRVETEVEGKILKAVVDYAFGSPDRYTSLVGRDDGGRSYILRLSHFNNGAAGSGWVRTTGHTADAGGGRDYQGKLLDAADGVLRCLFCHTTNPLAVLNQAGPESNDRAIGCERCHGPGGNHVKAVELKLADTAIVSPAQGSGEGSIRLCAQCHALHQQLDLSRTNTFWTRFQGTTLLWSRCYSESAGALDCTTCHDPHRNAEHSQRHYESKCLSCHSSTTQTGKTAAVTSCPVNPSKGCVGCHMPPFYSKPLRATFADHYIRVHRPPVE